MLEEGDRLLYRALALRDAFARDRLHAITHELLNDHSYNGAELGRRWSRGRATISVWKARGLEVRRSLGEKP